MCVCVRVCLCPGDSPVRSHPLAGVAAFARRRSCLRPLGLELFFVRPSDATAARQGMHTHKHTHTHACMQALVHRSHMTHTHTHTAQCSGPNAHNLCMCMCVYMRVCTCVCHYRCSRHGSRSLLLSGQYVRHTGQCRHTLGGTDVGCA